MLLELYLITKSKFPTEADKIVKLCIVKYNFKIEFKNLKQKLYVLISRKIYSEQLSRLNLTTLNVCTHFYVGICRHRTRPQSILVYSKFILDTAYTELSLNVNIVPPFPDFRRIPIKIRFSKTFSTHYIITAERSIFFQRYLIQVMLQARLK